MKAKSTAESWGVMARTLHWLMAVMILAQFMGGWVAEQMERSPARVSLMNAHKSLGLTVLLLLLLRIAWRLADETPAPLPGSPRREIALSKGVHHLLYLLMAAVPLSGWLAASATILPLKLWGLVPWPKLMTPDPAWQPLTANVHELLTWLLLAVLAVHVMAALYHHFVRRDRILIRMTRGRRP